ncbi:NAD(P)-dependent oxidoreductase [Yersinia enterocolitica]|uniref:NAD(P)-dependent oxidoreductase n=1 Tax=Yersinia enterocolitica TaxID=630 RepID=UPI003D06A3EA
MTWPAYLTRDRIEKASKLKLALTAGIGSDHVDLDAAAKAGITVAEITGSNSISVAEHVVMMVLSLVRNYLPSHQISADGGWNIADCVTRSYDVEGMHFGTIGAGRIGLAVLRRLKAFDRHCCKVSDEAAFCLIQRPYISKTLLTRRISPRGSP